jgi:hypothetical protein
MPKDYVKHLVECNCILPQFQNYNPPVFHKFVVFSTFNELGEFEPSYAQCPHCLAIHKVTEVFESKILPKESVATLPQKQDIKVSLPKKYVEILESYGSDLPIWQEVGFILENKLWGKSVILSREEDDGVVSGKYLLILGEDFCKIDKFSSEEEQENE